jgi:hypothetical protein
MKPFYSFFYAIVAAMLLAGCNKPTTAVNAPGSPAVDVAALRQAVQAFDKQEGHFPKTLDELTPKYIAKIPSAPSGYRLNYDPATGEIKIGR